MESKKQKTFVNKREASEMLGVSRSTLNRYIERELIQEHKSGLRTKIKISDIEELLENLTL